MKGNGRTNGADFSFSLLRESRALFEFAHCYSSMPLLTRVARKGDGHPVLVIPGFMGGDGSTRGLRKFLDKLGYEVIGWSGKRNAGFDDDNFERLSETIVALAAERETRISLVGHSLGGIYARLLAHEQPTLIRQIIMLGVAFNADKRLDTPISRFYNRLNPENDLSPRLTSGLLRQRTPVPSTSIYSKGDGIVPWTYCIEEQAKQTENVQVYGSHVGMPFNPSVLLAVADRLGQAETEWRPFRADARYSFLYGTFDPNDLPA